MNMKEKISQEKDSEIPNNKIFNEFFQERIERIKGTRELCSVLNHDFAMGTFWTTFLSNIDFNIQFDFSKHTVIDGSQFNLPLFSYKRIDCLIVDATQKHGVVICYHPAVSEVYPEPLEAGFNNLEVIVYVLFMPDSQFNQKLNDSQNERVYWNYSVFSKWLQSIKLVVSDSLFKKDIDIISNYVNIKNSNDIREYLMNDPEKKEMLDKYLKNLRNSNAFTYDKDGDCYILKKIRTYELGYWLMEVCLNLGQWHPNEKDSDSYETFRFLPLFKNKNGEPYSANTLRQYINKAKEHRRPYPHEKELKLLLKI